MIYIGKCFTCGQWLGGSKDKYCREHSIRISEGENGIYQIDIPVREMDKGRVVITAIEELNESY